MATIQCEYPTVHAKGDVIVLQPSDDLLLVLSVSDRLLFVYNRPFNRWTPPIPMPGIFSQWRPLRATSMPAGVSNDAHTFCIHSYHPDHDRHVVLFYGLSASYQPILLRTVHLQLPQVGSQWAHVLVHGERRLLYSVSRATRDIYELDIDGNEYTTIGRVAVWPDHLLIYRTRLYTVCVDAERRRILLSVFSLFRAKRRGTTKVLRQFGSIEPKIASNKNHLCICEPGHIDVFDITAGSLLYTFSITTMDLCSRQWQKTQFHVTQFGEMVVSSPGGMAKTRRMRTVRHLDAPSLSVLALRALHSYLPEGTKRTLGASPLGDTVSLCTRLWSV